MDNSVLLFYSQCISSEARNNYFHSQSEQLTIQLQSIFVEHISQFRLAINHW